MEMVYDRAGNPLWLVAENGCWNWHSYDAREGYGRIMVNLRSFYAHRWMYERLIGPIPAGLQIDHLCRNRRCVNPDHLEPVTHQENARRGVAARPLKTHCVHGHEFTPENTCYVPDRSQRYCRQCNRDKWIPRAVRRARQA